MAVYSAVTAGEKDPESPIDVNLISKLDQNPLAMFEGASGAPRLQAAGIDDGIISLPKIDYSASVGLTQGSIREGGSESGSGFVTKFTTKLYIPSNANSIEYYVYEYGTTTGAGGSRLATSTNNGTSPNVSSTSATWDGAGVLDVSDKSGWTDVLVQVAGSVSPSQTVTLLQVKWVLK